MEPEVHIIERRRFWNSGYAIEIGYRNLIGKANYRRT